MDHDKLKATELRQVLIYNISSLLTTLEFNAFYHASCFRSYFRF